MPTSDLFIRAYTDADAPAITAIYAHYVETSVATFEFDPPGLYATRNKFSEMTGMGHPVIVGEAGGDLVGYAYASTYRPRPGYRFTCENSIYLDPGHVGQGYGRALLEALIGEARAAGFAQMLAVITDGVEASIRLHERCGFVVRGRYPNIGHKFDRWLDIVHMQREL